MASTRQWQWLRIIWFHAPALYGVLSTCVHFLLTVICEAGYLSCYSHLQMEKRRLREVRQLAPHDREGMRCLPGTRADSATLCCLPQRGNVTCGYSNQLSQCAQVWRGSREAGLPGLKAGLSQTNWDKLVTLGMCGLTLSNLLSCLFKRFFRKTGTGAVALSLWGELANWSSKGNPMSCL